MNEYKYTTSACGPIFIQVTFQWMGETGCGKWDEGKGWASIDDIEAIRPRPDGEAILELRNGQYCIKETPDEVIERLKEWGSKS